MTMPRAAPSLRSALARSLTAHLPTGALDGAAIRRLDHENSARWNPDPPPATGGVDAMIAGVPVRIHYPPSPTGADPVLLWFHGGGMIMGSAAGNDSRARLLSDDAECVVIAPEYRLAPEHPFPAAFEDCLSVTRGAVEQGRQLGIDPHRIGVGGISAGGNLAASVALTLRGEIEFALLLLLCPMLDDRTHGHNDDDRPVWNGRLNHAAWRAYLNSENTAGDDVPWTAAPARCADLSGLCATYLDVGSLDLFLSEDLDFVARAATAGVSVENHVIPGAYHAWDSLVPHAPESLIAHRWRIAALTRAWGATSATPGS